MVSQHSHGFRPTEMLVPDLVMQGAQIDHMHVLHAEGLLSLDALSL